MLLTRLSATLSIALLIGLTACASREVQEPLPLIEKAAVASVICAYQATPFSPSSNTTKQARLELEHYDNCGLAQEGAESLADAAIFPFAAGGYWIGNLHAGQRLSYTITVPKAGFYDLTLRVRPPSPIEAMDGLITLVANGRDLPPTRINLSAQKEATWGDVILPLTYFNEGLQQLQLDILQGDLELDYLEWRYAETDQSPTEAVARMGVGINLGNTLDAPEEGKWAPAAQRHFFEDFAEAGFGHVRIPVTWDHHVSSAQPYIVDPAFLERVEQVVDWALAQGVYVILNAHHETWLKEHYGDAEARARFAAIWRQVATHMQQKPARLIFEILDEPRGMSAAEVDELNSSILAILRESNPTRLVVFSGTGGSSMDSLAAAAVPDDPYMIGSFHSYEPWSFAGECTRSWGSAEDHAQLAAIYQRAANWTKQTGVPIMTNALGAAHYDYRQPQNVCDPQARLNYLSAHVAQVHAHGIAATVWDDDGSFQIYHRQQRSWGKEKSVLLKDPY